MASLIPYYRSHEQRQEMVKKSLEEEILPLLFDAWGESITLSTFAERCRARGYYSKIVQVFKDNFIAMSDLVELYIWMGLPWQYLVKKPFPYDPDKSFDYFLHTYDTNNFAQSVAEQLVKFLPEDE